MKYFTCLLGSVCKLKHLCVFTDEALQFIDMGNPDAVADAIRQASGVAGIPHSILPANANDFKKDFKGFINEPWLNPITVVHACLHIPQQWFLHPKFENEAHKKAKELLTSDPVSATV